MGRATPHPQKTKSKRSSGARAGKLYQVGLNFGAEKVLSTLQLGSSTNVEKMHLNGTGKKTVRMEGRAYEGLLNGDTMKNKGKESL